MLATNGCVNEGLPRSESIIGTPKTVMMNVSASLSAATTGTRAVKNSGTSGALMKANSAANKKARVPYMWATITETKPHSPVESVNSALLPRWKKKEIASLKIRIIAKPAQCKRGYNKTVPPIRVAYQAKIKPPRVKAETVQPLRTPTLRLLRQPATNAESGIAGSVSQVNAFAPVRTRLTVLPMKAEAKPSQGPSRSPKSGTTLDTMPIFAPSTPTTGIPGI